jgi:hypothetical protein
VIYVLEMKFDLAQVLMAFGPIVINSLTYEMQTPIINEEYDDFVHLWRYIGYHLGIDDRYNPCNSAARSLQLRDEFFATVPHYTRACRPSTIIMVRSCLYGFGTHLGMGHRLFSALVIAGSQHRKWLDKSYLGMNHFYPRSAVAPIQWFLGSMVTRTWLRHRLNRMAMGRVALERNRPFMLRVISYYIMPTLATTSDITWIILDQLVTNKWLYYLTMLYLTRIIVRPQ